MKNPIRTTISILFLVALIIVFIFGWSVAIWWVAFGLFQVYNAYLDYKESNRKGYLYLWIGMTILWVMLIIIDSI